MNKIFSNSEYVTMFIILVLSFFPWGGLLGNTGMDISISVLKNLNGSIEDYLTLATVAFPILALLLALSDKGASFVVLLAFISPIALFIYSMIQTSGDFISSMEVANIIILILAILMLLRRFDIIKLKFLK